MGHCEWIVTQVNNGWLELGMLKCCEYKYVINDVYIMKQVWNAWKRKNELEVEIKGNWRKMVDFDKCP